MGIDLIPYFIEFLTKRAKSDKIAMNQWQIPRLNENVAPLYHAESKESRPVSNVSNLLSTSQIYYFKHGFICCVLWKEFNRITPAECAHARLKYPTE